jgi:prepilin-type N-terminal cleavage/methylation domain-containing protein
MNRYKKRVSKGFTLLEILLVIAVIGILAAIVLVAINPNRQLALVRDTIRKSDLNTVNKALEQYLIDNEGYPISIATGSYKDICPTGVEQVGGSTDCTGKVDLRVLVPTYLSSIPTDPTEVSYKVGINPDNNSISVWADDAEQREIGLNLFAISLAGQKDNTFSTDNTFGGTFPRVASILVQNIDNKILVSGRLSTYQGSVVNNIVRINNDGVIDPNFNVGTGFDSDVVTKVLQPDGKIIVGGFFTTYNGAGASRIIRLNSNGTPDSTFNIGAGFDGICVSGATICATGGTPQGVNILAIQNDGKILVGGDLLSYQNNPIQHLIRINN